jgi:hypothetical protein
MQKVYNIYVLICKDQLTDCNTKSCYIEWIVNTAAELMAIPPQLKAGDSLLINDGIYSIFI